MAGTYDVFPVCETSPAAETSGMGWPLFEGSMLYASVRPQAKGKQRTTKTTERYFYLTQHQLQFWEHQKVYYVACFAEDEDVQEIIKAP